jgi:hypothetical protein
VDVAWWLISGVANWGLVLLSILFVGEGDDVMESAGLEYKRSCLIGKTK